MSLNNLGPEALRAAMRTGTERWGQHGSALLHALYVEPSTCPPRRRRKCRCGCGRKQTHALMANGVALSGGCELSMRRKAAQWTKAKERAAQAPGPITRLEPDRP